MVFNNVYEMITPPSVIKKSWFVDYFDGTDKKAYWTLTVGVGTSTATMVDAVDGGLRVEITSATTSDRSALDFAAKRHYAHDGSVFDAIFRRVTADTHLRVGLAFSTGGGTSSHNGFLASDWTLNTNKYLRTSNGSSETLTESSIARNTNFTRYRGEINGTNARMWIAGVLEVTITATLPTTRMQPMLGVQNRATGSGKQGDFRYYEAYNT